MAVIVRDSDIQGGQPIFQGARIPVKALFEYLEGGQTIREFVEDFEGMTRGNGYRGPEGSPAASLAENESPV